MIEVLEHNKCTGCAACYTACSHNAIIMQYDEEGFEYPVINQESCLDCGLCQNVCPVLQYDKRHVLRTANNGAQIGYAARNKNFEQRMISSSGSIFPPIAEWILGNGGIVVGTAYDGKYNAVHLIIDTKEKLKEIQGSKYLQCKADNTTFKRIREELKTGRLVLYSGMACQVEGLKSYLRKDYDNLYTIDLICMGIPSSVVWQKYLNAFFKGEKILHINFKEKSIGWDTFSFYVKTDKREFKERGMENLYLQSMFRSWNMRPSCFQCPFKKEERFSDFTLADCWGASKLVPEINDNKGLSSVIVHSKKGHVLWQELSDRIDYREISIEDIAAGNSNLVQNKPKSGDRHLFYDLLERNPQKAFEKLCKVNRPSLLIRMKMKFVSIVKFCVK
jgi:coenzyme F420-reducing hydrogenase beta subunit